MSCVSFNLSLLLLLLILLSLMYNFHTHHKTSIYTDTNTYTKILCPEKNNYGVVQDFVFIIWRLLWLIPCVPAFLLVVWFRFGFRLIVYERNKQLAFFSRSLLYRSHSIKNGLGHCHQVSRPVGKSATTGTKRKSQNGHGLSTALSYRSSLKLFGMSPNPAFSVSSS